MAKFCPYCGMPIPEGAKFCVGCGSKLAKPDALPETQPAEQPMNALSAATAAPASRKSVPSLAAAASAAKQGAETLGKIVGIDAPVTGGEFEAGPIEGLGAGELTKGVSEILAPLQTLFGGLRSAFGGLKALFTGKNFKGLVVTGALTLIWTLLLGFRQSGVNGSARNVLDTLFFGQGGVGSNPLCILGGALGKGAFAAAAASLLGGGWRSLGGGVKSLCSGKHFQKDSLPLFLLGAGIALAVYQLFAWKATCTDVMAAVSGAVLALIALGGQSSLLRRLIRSLTARKDGTGRIGQDGKCGALLAGLAAGFGLGIPLSLTGFGLGIPLSLTGFGLTPLIVGGAALIAALVLLFVFRGRGGSGDGAASKRKTPENRSPRAPASASRQSLSRALLAGQALLLTLLLLGAALAEPVRVHASASEPTGYWEFVEIIEEQTESLTHVGYQYEETLSGSAVTGFVDRRVLTCEGYRYDDMGEEFRFHKGSCKGEFTEAVITFSPLPSARLDPGQELAITANAACSTSAHTVGVSGQTFIEYRYKLDGQGYTYFRSEETESLNYVFAPVHVWQYEKPPYTAGGSRAVGDRTETYRATIPQGTPGRTEDLYIRFYIHIGSESISTYYHYRWVDTTPPPVTAAVTETPTTAPETELPPTDGHEHDGTGPIETETDPWIVQIETRDADQGSGEEETGTDIIPAIVTGLLNIGAAAGGVLLGGAEEEEKEAPVYRMKLYKDFGNTIRQGEELAVYAHIVEETAKGEVECLDLTRKIDIYSSDGVFAIQPLDTLSGSYKAAWVSVAEGMEGKTDGWINFRYDGKGGVFVKQVRFLLDAPRVRFAQSNLALAAQDEEPGAVGFAVEGLDLEKVDVELHMSQPSSYEVEYVQAEDEEGKPIPGAYYALLSDVNGEVGEAGTYSVETLTVTASDGTHSVTGELEVYRVNTGLRIGVNCLNCFRTLKPTAAGKHVKDLVASDFDISYTRVPATVLQVDPEKHEMYYETAVAQFEIVPIDPEDALMRERLEGIGLECELTDVGDSVSEYTFYCKKGWLEPPLRAKVLLRASASAETPGGEEVVYCCEKEIVLLSQRKRDKIWQGDLDRDLEIERWMDDTQTMICDLGLMDDLGGEYTLMTAMWEAYDEHFGYDPILVAQIQSNITEYFHNVKKYALKKQQEYNLKRLETDRADENALTVWSKSFAMVSDKYLDTWGGVVVRIAAGFCTGGLSEIPFTLMDVNKAVSAYNEKTLLCDRTLGGKLWAGSVPLLMSAATAVGAKMAAYSAKTLGKELIALVPRRAINAARTALRSKIDAGLKKIPTSVKEGASKVCKRFTGFVDTVNSYDPRKRMFSVRKAAALTDAELSAARNNAQLSLLDVRKGALTQKGQFKSVVQRAAELRAARKVSRFKKAVDRIAADQSDDALKEYLAAFHDVKNDTFALNILNCDGKTAAQIASKAQIPNTYIASYNKAKMTYYEGPAEKLMKQRAAKIASQNTGRTIKEADIVINRASGKTQADLEKGYFLSFDSDNSPMLWDQESQKYIYFTQAETDAIVATSYCDVINADLTKLKKAVEMNKVLEIPPDGVKYETLMEYVDKAAANKTVAVTPGSPEYYFQFERLKSDKAFSKWAGKINTETGRFKMSGEFNVMEKQIDKTLADARLTSRIERECAKYAKQEIAELSDDALKAVSCVEKQYECIHQTAKTFDLHMNKDIHGRAYTGNSGFTEKSRIFAETCRMTEGYGASRLDLGELDTILERQGTNYSKMVDSMAGEFSAVNKNVRAANVMAAKMAESRITGAMRAIRPVSGQEQTQGEAYEDNDE